MSNDVSKSWFAVFNNPQDKGYPSDPKECCEKLRDEWITDYPTRSGAWAYCVSADGLHHVHMVLEDSKAMRFTAIKNTYAQGMHFEATKGSKTQAEAYIKKVGPWQEKGEKVLYIETYGEIKGNQGARNDLVRIGELLDEGKTPDQIMDEDIRYRKYEAIIRKEFYRRRDKATPLEREVNVTFICGRSGSGKSYTYIELCKEYGEENVYRVTDYDGGGFDNYCGQDILVLDEFRGQIKLSDMLNFLDKYKTDIHCRYVNAKALWTKVFICSVIPPEETYKQAFEARHEYSEQWFRRINTVVYCYKDGDKYKRYSMPMAEYTSYENIEERALGANTFFAPTREEEAFVQTTFSNS